MRRDDPRRPHLIVMLVGGERPGKIAAHFGVDGDTVRAWRDDPGVAAEVERIRDEMVNEARGRLKALAAKIPDALSKALEFAVENKDPFEIVKVCEAVADRIGLPKVAKVEQKITAEPSTVDEMTRQLVAIREKAAQGGQGNGGGES